MKKNKGITLIALIITIIVMLILVAVSVNILIKSNLIGTAEKTVNKYKTATEEEANGGTIEINGKKYNSIDDYMEEISPTIVEGDPDDWEFTVEDDDTITITGYKNTDTTIDTVVVPNYIGGKPVKKIEGGRFISSTAGGTVYFGAIWNNEICTQNYFSFGSWNYQQNITIKKVVLSPGIETIGKIAFAATINLSEVIIPSSVTNIEEDAFAGCSTLTKITIPSNVTNIGEDAFAGCSTLTEITIPNSVTRIENGVFSDCESLKKTVIPERVTFIGERAFEGCKGLTEIIIPKSVTSIGYRAFEYCESLKKIVITEGVDSIGCNAFGACISLTEIIIPSSVTTMNREVFWGIPSITVHVPWKEGEKPDGWDENWASTGSDCTITIDYAK